MGELAKIGSRFIGVVKTATKKFPMAYLDSIELEGQGDCKVIATLNDDNQRAEMVAVLWVDKNCSYFVGNSEGTAQVEPMYMTCWHQLSE